MASKPCQRSLKHLRDLGWQCAIVEKWIPPRGKMPFGMRVDVWGFGDILACRALPSNGDVGEIALIQTTDASSHSKHKEKILALPEYRKWKEAGGWVFLHSWGKRGPRGKRKVWTVREEVL